ncbi:hypothetical protein ES705_48483 [subsurface metagenome]
MGETRRIDERKNTNIGTTSKNIEKNRENKKKEFNVGRSRKGKI